jgi:hypothetical protein
MSGLLFCMRARSCRADAAGFISGDTSDEPTHPSTRCGSDDAPALPAKCPLARPNAPNNKSIW